MKGEWCYFKSYLDKATCESIIELAQLLPSQEAGLGEGGDTHTDSSVRRSTIRFINADDWKFRDLFNVLWLTAVEANRDFFGFHVTKLDFIQFAEYHATNQDEYREHHDVFWINEDPLHHRKLSCIIQLSDPNDYVGGDFEITEASNPPNPSEIKDQGSIIYFPSFFRHRANPVIRGTRYSIAAWFEGPKWR